MRLVIRSKMLSFWSWSHNVTFHILMIKVSSMVAVHSASGLFQTPLSSLVWFTVLPWWFRLRFGALNHFLSLLHRSFGTGSLHHSRVERLFSLRRINQNFRIVFLCQRVSMLSVLVSLLRHFFFGLSRGVPNKRILHTQRHTTCTAQFNVLSRCFLCLVTESSTTKLLQRLFELFNFGALKRVSH